VGTIRSKDGTTIAFDRLGDGSSVIVVGRQLCDRALTRPTVEELAKRFTVFNYDRRGRVDSGDTTPYAIEREVEDIGALIAEAGGTASLYGHSSGVGSLCTCRRTACLSTGSRRTSRLTCPTARRSDETCSKSERNSSPSWQRIAVTTQSS